ncbi:MAG TPA: hypothetical protein VKX45_06795 [Bryobacteraceae bacterium]|nr:hypothetical protein [Bryobacteraceae bacterium]
MASEKQIAANRRNAQKSTGPRTQAGKEYSRMNAFRSGLYSENLVIRGEYPDELEMLTEDYHQEFQPATPRERDLVDAIVRNEWISRRMAFVEVQLWGHYHKVTAATPLRNPKDELDRKFPLGQAFLALSKPLERLQRRINSLERSTREALRELAELRAQREAQPEDQAEALEEELAAAEPEFDAPIESAIENPAEPAPHPIDAEPVPQPVDAQPTPDPIGFVPSTLSAELPPPVFLHVTPASGVHP